MKITCPECSAPFDVPVAMIAPGGQRVRCSSCGHVWLQEPAVEPTKFGGFRAMEEDDIEPIPASLHPDHRDDDEDGDGEGFLSGINWAALGKMLLGFVLALAVLAGATYGLAMAGLAPKFLMPLAKTLGVEPQAMASGLEFSDVTARVSNNMTVVTGKVSNVSESELALPPVEITPVDADGTRGEGKRIALPQETLKAGENITFGAELQGVLEAEGRLDVRFVD